MYLPDERNDTSPEGKETGFISRKLAEFIEKCCISCICKSFISREAQILSMAAGESLQFKSSSDVKLSRF